jgi:hypothetical protein
MTEDKLKSVEYLNDQLKNELVSVQEFNLRAVNEFYQ